MRGSIVKRGGRYAVVVDLGRDENGKRIRKWHSGFERRKDAERARTEILAQLDSASYVTPAKLTVERFLVGEWLPTVERTLRPLSYTQYEQAVRLRIVPRIGHVRLQGLSAGHLNALYTELEREGLSTSTRRLTHAVVHRALRDGVRWGRLVRNPAELADPPTRSRSRAQAWTSSEVGRFLDRVRDDRYFALWRLAATTGMRRGELAGLTWRCVDLEGARVSVEQQLVPTRGGATLGPPKSARSRRTIALDAETVDALRRHLDTQLLERDVAGAVYEDRDLVFCDELGGSIHPQRLTEWFTRHRKAVGIPTGTLHILRHTAATLALTSGVPVHIVAARLGDTPTTVLSTYAHLLPQSDEIAAERVAAMLD